jgi:hypothetical protein
VEQVSPYLIIGRSSMKCIETYWVNKRGKAIRIQSIPLSHLNNIRKMFTIDNGRNKISDIMDELKRRKLKN